MTYVCSLVFIYDVFFLLTLIFLRKGKDGNACVRRALCETGQQNQNGEKGPFLMEILRAVFSLPDQVEENYEKDFHQQFDNAHQQIEHNCADLYSKCETSIWSSDFSF